MADASPPRRSERPTIVVQWRDHHGVAQSIVRKVHFEKGFGYYVKHNKRTILVDPLDKVLLV